MPSTWLTSWFLASLVPRASWYNCRWKGLEKAFTILSTPLQPEKACQTESEQAENHPCPQTWPLQRAIFTHRNFYGGRRNFYTEKILHREAFKQSSSYTQKVVHREAFTQKLLHRGLCIEQVLHKEGLAQQPFTQEQLLHRGLWTEQLFHRAGFTHRSHYTNAFTHRSLYTQKF